jgi:peptidoglycan/xylan/chitin deacetylase (PgdA/CDA1 family)
MQIGTSTDNKDNIDTDIKDDTDSNIDINENIDNQKNNIDTDIDIVEESSSSIGEDGGREEQVSNNSGPGKAVEKPKPVGPRIPILMYHHFTEKELVRGFESSTITIDNFKNQLELLKAEGFNAITLADLRSFIKEGKLLPANPFVVTIDDGYGNNYTLAYPVLKEMNIKVNINIIVSYRGEQPGYNKHFTWDEAREMHESGLIEFGSHTYNLHTLDIKKKEDESNDEYRDRIYEDFKKSRDLMTEELGFTPYILAFPYGIFNSISQGVAKELGFDILLTVNPGITTKESSLLSLRRINVSGKDSPKDLIKKIKNYMGE